MLRTPSSHVYSAASSGVTSCTVRDRFLPLAAISNFFTSASVISTPDLNHFTSACESETLQTNSTVLFGTVVIG